MIASRHFLRCALMGSLLGVAVCAQEGRGQGRGSPTVPGELPRAVREGAAGESLRQAVWQQEQEIRRQRAQLRRLEEQLAALSPEVEAEQPVRPAAYRAGRAVGGAWGVATCPGCGVGSCGGCSGCAGCGGASAGCCGCGDPGIRIGGQYRLMYNASNFDFHPASITDAQQSQTFFNQRFRTWLTVRPNENVEGYLQVEMGHIGWGENFDFPKTYVGPRFPGADDRVGVEMRYGYLGYQTEAVGRWRAGIQPWQDSFGQTLASSDWDFGVGGLSWARTFPGLGGMEMLFGIFSLFEGDPKLADDAVLVTLDLDWQLDEAHSWGFSVYYLPDRGAYSYPGLVDPLTLIASYDHASDVWIGLRAAGTVGRLPWNGFVIYNTGQRDDGASSFSHDDAALKLELGPLPFWVGGFRFQTLYSTGDDNPDENFRDGFRTVAQSVRDNFGAQGYWSYLVLSSPHGPSDVNDLGVSLQNRGLGLFTVQAAYDYPLFDRLSGTIAVGWLQSDARNPASGSRDMGTELANMFLWDLGGGLKADLGAAVLFTGDFYKPAVAAPAPDVLWEAFTRVQLEF